MCVEFWDEILFKGGGGGGGGGGDSCHGRVMQNQQNLYSQVPPTVVVKLLQYSCLGSNTGMSFLRTNDLSEIKTAELNLDFKVVIKTVGWWLFTN